MVINRTKLLTFHFFGGYSSLLVDGDQRFLGCHGVIEVLDEVPGPDVAHSLVYYTRQGAGVRAPHKLPANTRKHFWSSKEEEILQKTTYFVYSTKKKSRRTK